MCVCVYVCDELVFYSITDSQNSLQFHSDQDKALTINEGEYLRLSSSVTKLRVAMDPVRIPGMLVGY